MINIIISGVAGRMGKMISQVVFQDNETKLVGGTETIEHPGQGKDIGILNGLGQMNISVTDKLKDIIGNCDVIINFTTPQNTISNLDLAAANSKGIVIGTTGLSEDQKNIINEKSKNIPIVFSPNMSIGVNLLFYILENITSKLKGFDIEIIEKHHNKKKDAPSGTAIKMSEIIAKQRNLDLDKSARYGRKGITGERKPDELGIHAIRGGNIVGEHTAIFAYENDIIEISHKALSRMTFAKGAVEAAKFLKNKKTGIYSMSDVLNLNE